FQSHRQHLLQKSVPARLSATSGVARCDPDTPHRNCRPPVRTLALARRSIAGLIGIHTWHAPPSTIRSPRITLQEDRRDEDLRPAVSATRSGRGVTARCERHRRAAEEANYESVV